MAKRSRKIIRRTLATVVMVGLLVAGLVAFTHRQQISDHFAAQGFKPSQEVSELVESLQLTDAGRRIFLASSPTLDASQNFNTQCAGVEHGEGSHVLGCFTGGKIHLFQVTDDRLDGIVEVTAAHELLHAAYSRIDSDAKAHLSQKLRETYAELIKTNTELETRMSVYSELSDQGFANELHSILGTEVRELPEWLQDHYSEWFTDRGVIVDRFDDYRAVFVEIQSRINELQNSLEVLRTDIEQRSAAYDEAVQSFNDQVAEFNRRNEAFEFSDRETEFMTIRGGLQQWSAELQNELLDLQADIARHEDMRIELEELGATSAELNERLNSQLAPALTP